MAYIPVTDEDRLWATEGGSEERIFGPCAIVVAWVNSAVYWIQDQSGMQKIAMLLGVLCVLGILNGFIEDEQMSILVPGDGVCADKVQDGAR